MTPAPSITSTFTATSKETLLAVPKNQTVAVASNSQPITAASNNQSIATSSSTTVTPVPIITHTTFITSTLISASKETTCSVQPKLFPRKIEQNIVAATMLSFSLGMLKTIKYKIIKGLLSK